MILTDKQHKALTIIRDHPGITTGVFAGLYYSSKDNKDMFKPLSSGYGYGRRPMNRAWICAANVLTRLGKKGWIIRQDDCFGRNKYRLTDQGHEALKMHAA